MDILRVLPTLLWLVTATLAATGCSRPVEPPRLILHNGVVHQEAQANPAPTAVALGEERILAIGSDAEILARRSPETQVIDLQGAWVGPAFTDHHIHMLNLGLSILNGRREEPFFADLTSASSLDDLIGILGRRAESRPAGTWILGKGWSQSVWGEGNLPTHEVLTRHLPDHPVFLTRVDGHAGWINREAMQSAGITRETPDPPGGSILRSTDGEPSGVLLERANELIVPLLPEIPDDVIRDAFRAAAEAMAERGFTRVYDAGFLAPPGIVALNYDLTRILELLLEEDSLRPLPIDINLMIPAPSALAETLLAQPPGQWQKSDRIRITHLKLFADGAMGSRGASLSHPFADDSATRGVPRMSLDEIREWTIRPIDAGLDVAIHAIGDTAVRQALNTHREVRERRPETLPGRLRIEHFSYAIRDDLERAAQMGFVLSIQPNFIYPDASGRTMEDSRVGERNSARVYAWGSLNRFGALLAGGSDYFGMLAPALQTYHSALTRANPEGAPPEGWHPAERLDREAAFGLMHRFFPPGGGAVESGFRVGAPADLVILSADPMAASESALLGIRVLATFRDGETVYRDGGFAFEQN